METQLDELESSASTPEYAGFWKRFAANVLDGVIIIFVTMTFRYFIFLNLQMEFRDTESRFDFGFEDIERWSYYIWSFYLIIIQWCYFAGMESSPLRASLGKMMVGIYVTDLHGERVSFARATGRHFGKILSGLILLIGYIMAGTTPKKQALHDQMAECLVLSR